MIKWLLLVCFLINQSYQSDRDDKCLLVNRDLPGDTISRITGVSTTFHCIKLCAEEATCRAVVWISRTDTCLLKGPESDSITADTWVAKSEGGGGVVVFLSCLEAAKIAMATVQEAERRRAAEVVQEVESAVETQVLVESSGEENQQNVGEINFEGGLDSGLSNDYGTQNENGDEMSEENHTEVVIQEVESSESAIVTTVDDVTSKIPDNEIESNLGSADEQNQGGNNVQVRDDKCLLVNRDLPGDTISRITGVSTTFHCIKLCTEDATCRAVVWMSRTEICLLKGPESESITADTWVAKSEGGGGVVVFLSCLEAAKIAMATVQEAERKRAAEVVQVVESAAETQVLVESSGNIGVENQQNVGDAYTEGGMDSEMSTQYETQNENGDEMSEENQIAVVIQEVESSEGETTLIDDSIQENEVDNSGNSDGQNLQNERESDTQIQNEFDNAEHSENQADIEGSVTTTEDAEPNEAENATQQVESNENDTEDNSSETLGAESPPVTNDHVDQEVNIVNDMANTSEDNEMANETDDQILTEEEGLAQSIEDEEKTQLEDAEHGSEMHDNEGPTQNSADQALQSESETSVEGAIDDTTAIQHENQNSMTSSSSEDVQQRPTDAAVQRVNVYNVYKDWTTSAANILSTETLDEENPTESMDEPENETEEEGEDKEDKDAQSADEENKGETEFADEEGKGAETKVVFQILDRDGVVDFKVLEDGVPYKPDQFRSVEWVKSMLKPVLTWWSWSKSGGETGEEGNEGNTAEEPSSGDSSSGESSSGQSSPSTQSTDSSSPDASSFDKDDLMRRKLLDIMNMPLSSVKDMFAAIGRVATETSDSDKTEVEINQGCEDIAKSCGVHLCGIGVVANMCKRTCGICPSGSEVCKNEYSDTYCFFSAGFGYCEHEEIARHCRESCEMCVGVCKDVDTEFCEMYGKFHCWNKEVRDMCSKSCFVC